MIIFHICRIDKQRINNKCKKIAGIIRALNLHVGLKAMSLSIPGSKHWGSVE